MRWRQSFDNCLERFDGPNRMGSSYYVRPSARLAGLVGKLWLSQIGTLPGIRRNRSANCLVYFQLN
jgi:hypothetical protein